MNIVAVSGSLRAASINTAVCRVAAQVAPPALRISVFEDLLAALLRHLQGGDGGAGPSFPLA